MIMSNKVTHTVIGMALFLFGCSNNPSNSPASSSSTNLSVTTSSVISSSSASVGSSSVGSNTASKKWHPGHYAGLMTLKMPEGLLKAADIDNFDIKDMTWDTENLRTFIGSLPDDIVGIEIGVTWRMLEGDSNSYDFSFIDSALAVSESFSKYVFIHVSERSFQKAIDPAPDYIKNMNGIMTSEHWDGGGDIAMIWKPIIAARYFALIKALGIAFNDHPSFEGITFPESALGSDADTDLVKEIEWSDSNYLHYMMSRVDTAKQYFPDCVVFQGINWGHVDSLTAHAIRVGAGLYGPDLEPDISLRTDIQVNRIQSYEHIIANAGAIPMGMDVQEPEYLIANDKLVDVTAEKIFAMGVETLKLNYIFWNVVEGEGLAISFSQILAVIAKEDARINRNTPLNW